MTPTAVVAGQAFNTDTKQWSTAGAFRSSRLLNFRQGVHAPAVAEVRVIAASRAHADDYSRLAHVARTKIVCQLNGLLYLVGGSDSTGALSMIKVNVSFSYNSAPQCSIN